MTAQEFKAQVKENLTENILPYWLALKEAPRGAILGSRVIWAFSAAYRALGKREYLDAAMKARDWFLNRFFDRERGGVYWSISDSGDPLETKKQLYSQGFAIYGLSELALATGDREALEAAISLFRLVEKRFADKKYGGYTEALAMDFTPLADMSLSAHDINADKTMNSHLHILEAYANLYRVWPDEALKAATERLLDLVCGRIMGPDGHLQLYFNRDWTVLPGAVSYGHDIETSWLAMECAMALNEPEVLARVRPFALKMGRAGNDGLLPDGSMRYEKLPSGEFDDSRQWWVQAEAVVGNLWLWKYHGVKDGKRNAFRTWDYINGNLVDHEGGEWWWAILPDGTPDLSQPKAGFWKCPYHNTRMCLQAISIFENESPEQ